MTHKLPPDWSLRAVESALDAIITIDSADVVVQFNGAAERMFGYTRDEAIGRPLTELIIPPDLRDAHVAGLRRVTSGGAGQILDQRVTLQAMRRDGSEFPIELTVTRLSDAPQHFTGFVRDLSQLHEAERRSIEMARQFSDVERLAGVGTWTLDLDSGAMIWSDGMHRINAISSGEDVAGVARLLETVHPEDRDRLAALFGRVVEHPDSVPAAGLTVEYRAVGPDGAVHEIRAHGRIEHDADGAPARWTGVAHDLTEQRRVERELLAHSEVASALHDWNSFEEGIAGLLRRIGEALHLSTGALWVHDATEKRLTRRAFWSAPGVDAVALEERTRRLAYRPGESAPGLAWETARPVIVPEPQDDGLGSELAFPALGPSGPVAVLAFASQDRLEADEQFVATLEGIGRAVGRFLARRSAELQPAPLSARELEVLRLAAEGNSGPRIAELLMVSPATIKTHFENIYTKLGVGDRAGAVALALRTGLIL